MLFNAKPDQPLNASASRTSNSVISIRDLLNDGTESFTETFNMPASKSLMIDSEVPEYVFTPYTGSEFPIGANQEITDLIMETTADPVAVVDPLGTYEGFWNGPFPALSPSLEYDMLSSASTFLASAAGSLEMDSGLSDVEIEVPPPYVSSLVEAVLNSISSLNLDDRVADELKTATIFLFTKQQVSKFVSFYFRNWHLNCPFLHQASFDPGHVPTTLLLTVSLLGAMYSREALEVYATKRLLDVAELVVFNTDIFSPEAEIVRSISGTDVRRDEIMQQRYLESFQAGYLMFTLQYWAGTRTSKTRAVDTLFGRVVAVGAQYSKKILHES